MLPSPPKLFSWPSLTRRQVVEGGLLKKMRNPGDSGRRPEAFEEYG